MKKVKIIITGKAHDIGCRSFKLVKSLLMERFDARNVLINGKQAIVVFVECEDEVVDRFVELVKTERPENAVVEEIKVEDYDGFGSSIMPNPLLSAFQAFCTLSLLPLH